MRLVLLELFVFISSVICINENVNSDQSVVQRRYNFNHPPSVENYNPIPVAVVYEDDVIPGKSLKLETEEVPNPNAKITEISQPTDKPPIKSEGIEKSTVVAKSIKEADSEQDDIPVRPKPRALSDLQIPVAVVYDSVPDSTTKPEKTLTNETTIPKRRYKQIRRRKEQQNRSSTDYEKLVISNTEPTKPKIKNIESLKPQQRQMESIKSQPQNIESVRQNPSRIETKTRRERDPVVPIIESQNYVFAHSGNFHYSYEGGDGTKAYSEGQLRSVNDEAAGEAVSGGFSYTDKEGNDFSLSYTADENGYRPTGAHLPTPPPIPPAIARALAYLATATTPEPVTKPSAKKHTVN